MVTNTGNVTLSNIALSDLPVIATFYSTQALTTACTIPATLAAGASFTCYGSLAWAAGQQTDTATASGTFGGTTYTDTDPANYFGTAPAMTIVKTAVITPTDADGTIDSPADDISYSIRGHQHRQRDPDRRRS